MKTYSKLSINQKINYKGNTENRAKCYGNFRNPLYFRFDVAAMDLVPSYCESLIIRSQYAAHLMKGQNINY